MVLLEFSMSPLGKSESVGKYVARSLDIIDKSGVAYRLNPMGTVLEGEWEQVFSVVQQCYERMKKDCNRISCTIKVDYRKGYSGRLQSKVASVEKKLKRSVRQYEVPPPMLCWLLSHQPRSSAPQTFRSIR